MPPTDPGSTTSATRCAAAVLELPSSSNPTALLAELCADRRLDMVRIVVDRPRPTVIDATSIRTRCDTLLSHLSGMGLDDRRTAELIDSIRSTEPDTARTLLLILRQLLRGASPLIVRIRAAGRPDFVIPPGFLDAVGALFGVRVEKVTDASGAGATDIMRPPPHRYVEEAGRQLLELLTGPDEDLAESWSRWLEMEMIEHLRGFSLVAPTLLERLMRIGFEDEETGRLSGIRRRAWYANSLVVADVTAMTTALRSIEVTAVITGELIDGIDADVRGSVRAIERPSLLIDPDDARRAIDVLRSIHPGLSPDTLQSRLRPPLALTQTRLELPARGGRSIDLQWRWLPDRASNRVPLVAEDLRIIDLEGSPMRALAPTARLIEKVADSVRPAPRPAFTTRVRTMELIDHHHEMIDWTRVQWACERLELSEHLRELIGSLPERTRASVPVPL